MLMPKDAGVGYQVGGSGGRLGLEQSDSWSGGSGVARWAPHLLADDRPQVAVECEQEVAHLVAQLQARERDPLCRIERVGRVGKERNAVRVGGDRSGGGVHRRRRLDEHEAGEEIFDLSVSAVVLKPEAASAGDGRVELRNEDG